MVKRVRLAFSELASSGNAELAAAPKAYVGSLKEGPGFRAACCQEPRREGFRLHKGLASHGE
jgi:hypothetical protein